MGKKSLREDEVRAKAAERLLNRKRMGLECAIEALEAVGYEVRQNSSGYYKVMTPAAPVAVAPEPVVVEIPIGAGFLDEYPDMLSPQDVAKISGITEASVRRMCKEKRLASSKIGGRVRIPKDALVSLMR